MNAVRFAVLVLCFFVAAGPGCQKAEQPSVSDHKTDDKPSVGETTESAGNEKVESEKGLDVAEVLQKGGKNWSSLETFSTAGEDIKAGEGFWVWPAEDKVWSTTGEDLVVNLRWKKRVVNDAPNDNPVGAEIAGAGPGMEFRSYTPITGFDAAANEGTADANFRFSYKGEGDVVVYLVAGGKKPVSNLLRLKAKSAP